MKALTVALTSAFALHVAAAAGLSTLGRGHSSGVHAETTGATVEVDQAATSDDTAVHEDAIAEVKGAEHQEGARGVRSPVHVMAVGAASSSTGETVPNPQPTQTAPVHFKMSIGAPMVRASGVMAPGVSASDEVVSDSDVTERAKNVAGSAPIYPADALSQNIELDAPLAFEIVVDTSGHVADARALSHAGHGFDEAALAALRTYRFTPASRNGHAVNVRMKWLVDFHFKS